MIKLLAAALSAALLAVPVAAAPAPAGQTYVNGSIRQSVPGSGAIDEPWLGIHLNFNAYGGGFSFSGQPFSGSASRSGDHWSVFGGQVSAQVDGWGGSYRVNATVPSRDPRQPSLNLFFTLQADGRTDDPRFPPSYSVFDSGCNLNLRPLGDGRQYDLSGWVDPIRFGKYGTALVGLVAAAAIQARAAAFPAPPPQAPAPAGPKRLPPLAFPLH